jgi:hypothetical protein
VENFPAAFKAVRSTTKSPQIHHDLPRKTPRSAHAISRNPLKKRGNHHTEKNKV